MPHTMENIANDLWNSHANNCELRWNPATGKVEVYSLRTSFLMKNWDLTMEPPSGTKHTTVSYPESKPSKLKTTTDTIVIGKQEV